MNRQDSEMINQMMKFDGSCPFCSIAGNSSLRADSTDSLTRSEVPPPVESAHQQDKGISRESVESARMLRELRI